MQNRNDANCNVDLVVTGQTQTYSLLWVRLQLGNKTTLNACHASTTSNCMFLVSMIDNCSIDRIWQTSNWSWGNTSVGRKPKSNKTCNGQNCTQTKPQPLYQHDHRRSTSTRMTPTTTRFRTAGTRRTDGCRGVPRKRTMHCNIQFANEDWWNLIIHSRAQERHA